MLSEYVMRQAVCGYSAYGQRVLDAATRAATAVQLVAQRANDKYWYDEALMSGLTNTLRGQVADAFTLAEKPEATATSAAQNAARQGFVEIPRQRQGEEPPYTEKEEPPPRFSGGDSSCMPR